MVNHVSTGLQDGLVLLSWLNSRLGYANTAEMLADVAHTNEGYDSRDRSYISARLATRSARFAEFDEVSLARYDENIRRHLESINERRSPHVVLRYFQYMALLYTEMFLDRRTRSRDDLVRSLNTHVDWLNTNRAATDRLSPFGKKDLDKLAYWMATGSGKTLLMHINCRQFLHYDRSSLDNILLICPNEALSYQHLTEFRASGFRARRLSEGPRQLGLGEPEVQVTEITKLVLEKQGLGQSVAVEALQGKNLILVDEGHKGAGGDSWMAVRDELARDSFTFEYSATFGQALAAAGDVSLQDEYQRAIAFDYSYGHFHSDGYGKDFHIVNVAQMSSNDQIDVLLTANLLSFYEQILLYETEMDALSRYNLSRPLWLFVGNTVNVADSDLLTIIRFLQRLLKDASWTQDTIRDLLAGKSGLVDASGHDLFVDRYAYLTENIGNEASVIYTDLLRRCLHGTPGGSLRLAPIGEGTGEFGMKVHGSDRYFGLVFVGNLSSFQKVLNAWDPTLLLPEDRISRPIFPSINEPDSGIHLLVGSRRFLEGWNSWRVSNMGLLNLGRHEGSQIVQMFGRGVRLRGIDMCLKRSAVLDGEHPSAIGLLETLNIFALRADYMTKFLQYLRMDGIDISNYIELTIPIQLTQTLLDKGLVVPKIDDSVDFTSASPCILSFDESLPPVTVDMSGRIQTVYSQDASLEEARGASGVVGPIPKESRELINWQRLFLDVLRHKNAKRMSNMIIRIDDLQEILCQEDNAYTLIATDVVRRPRSEVDWSLLQTAATSIILKYAERLYARERRRWQSDHMVYDTIDATHPNLTFNDGDFLLGNYRVRIPGENAHIISELHSLISNPDRLYGEESDELRRIYFDHHLYQPLLLDDLNRDVTLSPPGLVSSEVMFVDSLREFCATARTDSDWDATVVLLRNQGRGRGVGFFENQGFFPDFILWIIRDEGQRVVFVEPHGMLHEENPAASDKVQLCVGMPMWSRAMSHRNKRPDVSVDAYIVSATPFATLKNRWPEYSSLSDFAANHVLFPIRRADYDYMEIIVG